MISLRQFGKERLNIFERLVIFTGGHQSNSITRVFFVSDWWTNNGLFVIIHKLLSY
jgi:hypothetical protein